ncbi:Alkaline phosphatase synthesis sensor protein PhoR [compost metagenome]
MEVKGTGADVANTKPHLIREYWPRFRKRFILFTVSMQIVTTIVVGGALVITGVFELPNLAFIITLVTICSASIGVNLILVSLVTEPTRNLMDALTHSAGEPTITTPPNPNAKQFAKSGFREALQTIYKLSSATSEIDTPAIASSDDLVTRALDNTSCGFVALDKDRNIIYNNKSAPVHADIDGKTVLDLVFSDKENLNKWLDDCEESAVHAEKTWSRIADKLPGEEGRRMYDVVATYQKGSTAETVLSLFNRTDQYIPEEDDLDFIAFAAHELRGPITVIRGYLDVLEDELQPVLQNDQSELLKRLVVSANRLSSYINNILNASRFDRRHLNVHLKEESMASIYDTIKDDMQLRATAQNRVLGVAIPTDLPTVAADRGSIGEVLGNLIDNAVKYSNEGGVVNVSAAAKGDFVEVSVEDHGIGMPGNVVSSLFHKFYRSHRSRETVAGTGIGLYITKAFVESHGGHISVRSVENEGSVFTFSLPIYATVADKLKANNNSNESLIETSSGWIKNHSMYRG